MECFFFVFFFHSLVYIEKVVDSIGHQTSRVAIQIFGVGFHVIYVCYLILFCGIKA